MYCLNKRYKERKRSKEERTNMKLDRRIKSKTKLYISVIIIIANGLNSGIKYRDYLII